VLGLELDICGGHAMLDDEADKPMFRRNGVAYEVVLQRRRSLLTVVVEIRAHAGTACDVR
jgi:hypothetical protein